MLLITVAVFVGGLFDIGPILILIGAPVASLILALENPSGRIQAFLWGLVGLALGYGILEWVGRLAGAFFR